MFMLVWRREEMKEAGGRVSTRRGRLDGNERRSERVVGSMGRGWRGPGSGLGRGDGMVRCGGRGDSGSYRCELNGGDRIDSESGV